MASRSPILGVDVSRVDTDRKFPLGEVYVGDGVEYVYLKGNALIARSIPVKRIAGGLADVSGNAGEVYGISPDTPVKANEFGWFATKGEVAGVNATASVAAGALLKAVSDANGDVTSEATATNARRGVFLTATASDVATILLY